MFEPFDEEKQNGFGDFDFNLPDNLKEQLNKGWPGKFYEHVFTEIDESKFAAMYDSQYGRPNFSVKIIISLEIMKHQFDLSDKELLERFHFDARYIKEIIFIKIYLKLLMMIVLEIISITSIKKK